MQSIGKEQTFQTLFRELRLDDERVAPRFVMVWAAAQTSTRPTTSFKLSFVVSAALMVVGLFSFGIWFGSGTRNHQHVTATVIPSVISTIDPAPQALKPAPMQVGLPRARYHVTATRQETRLPKHRRVELQASQESEIRNIVAVSSWQSPTAVLMQSPADDVLMSVLHLYRSVNDLSSFLPDTQ